MRTHAHAPTQTGPWRHGRHGQPSSARCAVPCCACTAASCFSSHGPRNLQVRSISWTPWPAAPLRFKPGVRSTDGACIGTAGEGGLEETRAGEASPAAPTLPPLPLHPPRPACPRPLLWPCARCHRPPCRPRMHCCRSGAHRRASLLALPARAGASFGPTLRQAAASASGGGQRGGRSTRHQVRGAMHLGSLLTGLHRCQRRHGGGKQRQCGRLHRVVRAARAARALH